MRRRFKMLASAAVGIASLTPVNAARTTERPGAWPQSYAGRTADPAIRFGQLPNGMRYAIERNGTPPGQMSLRLLIGSGSLAETDEQRGLAHYLEHMAFRGSAHVPDGEMTRILARYGLAFGADTNASTSQEATIYKFDFPKAAPTDIDTGLMLFREIASNLILSKASLDAERGVILSEERLRDTPAYREAKGQVAFLLPGQLAANRWPIGEKQIIEKAAPEQLRSFYEKQYRPDNAVLVAVGDFDPAMMEEKIRKTFSDWKSVEDAPRPAMGSVQRRSEAANVFSEAGAPQNMQISWVRPYDDTADTDEREDRDDVRAIATLVFNHRLEELAQTPNAPFVAAQLSRSKLLKSSDVTNLDVVSPADRWQSAMRAAVDEQRRAVRFGVSQAELDRVITELRSFYTANATASTTRETPKLADGIAKNVTDDDVTRSPQQDLAELAKLATRITPAAVDDALRDMFTGSGPLLFLSTPQPPAGGEQALRSAFDAAMRDDLKDTAASREATWPYATFGVPSRVVERKEIAGLGLTMVRFANGTTLTVKPTAFAKDQVLTAIGFGTGRLGLKPGDASDYWLVNGIVPAFVAQGTGKLTPPDIDRALAVRTSKIELGLTDRRFELFGQTQSASLPFEMQLGTAYLADPGSRPEVVERFKAGIASALPQIDATATGVLQRERAKALHGGDRRWTTIPSAADVAATKPGDLAEVMRPELLSAPADVVVVGDVTTDAAIASVAATLGALPVPNAPAAKSAAMPRFPESTGSVMTFLHHGRADQSIVVVAWKTQDFFTNPQDARALQVTAEIIRQRLIDQLREVDGATYSPQTEADASQTIPGYGYLAVTVEVPPAKIPLLRLRLDSITQELKTKSVTSDELERAKAPLVATRTKEMQQNAYWLRALSLARNKEDLEAIRTRIIGIQNVTSADITRISNHYLQLPSQIMINAAAAYP